MHKISIQKKVRFKELKSLTWKNRPAEIKRPRLRGRYFYLGPVLPV